MGLFDNFPYTNLHELNLDWILRALKDLEKTIEQFVSINSLKYADPIQWNITSQYEKNTIVIDPQTGTAYISVQAVPAGVALTDTDYWTVVFNLKNFVVNAAKNFTTRYEEDTTLTATFSSAAGDWLVWGDVLYRALVNITAGDSYVDGGNIQQITIEEIKDEIYAILGNLTSLNTTDKSNLVAAINEVLLDVSNEVSDRQTAINSINNAIGALASLNTTDKSNLVAAINEVLLDVSNEVSDRQTAISGVQNSINTLTGTVNTLNADMNDLLIDFKGKKIHIIGDSISDINVLADNWAVQFKARAEIHGATVTIDGVNGASIAYDSGTQIASLNTRFNNTNKDMDILIIQLGVNDWILNHSFLDLATELATFWSNVNSIAAPPLVYWIMPFKNKDPRTSLHPMWLDLYRAYYALFSSSNGIRIIDGANIPILNTMSASNIAKYYLNDTYELHPNVLGSKYVCDYVMKKVLSGGDNTITPFLTYIDLTPFERSGSPFTLRTKHLTFDSFGTVHMYIEGYGTATTTSTNILNTIEQFKYLNGNMADVYAAASVWDVNNQVCYGTFKFTNGVLSLELLGTDLNKVVAFSGEIVFNISPVYDNYGSIA